MVPEVGIEPTRLTRPGILSPMRLPIPPFGHKNFTSNLFIFMIHKFKIGDAVILKDKYNESGNICIITNIYIHSLPGDGGWISFIYEAVSNNGKIINLTESCIDCLVELKSENGRAPGI